MVKLLFILITLGGFLFYSCQYQKEQNDSSLKSEKDVHASSSNSEHILVKHEEKNNETAPQKSVSLAHLKDINAFMGSYCYQCHGEKKQKGKLRLDTLDFNKDTILAWQDVVDQLTTGDMPPEDEKAPSSEERQKMISAVQDEINKFDTKPESSILRRLTQREYLNTVRDLFEMRTEVFMGASEFPPDERKHNFSNNGETLVTSSYLMDKYLDAANAVVKQILPEEKAKPKTQKWIFTPPFDTRTRDYVSWFYGKYKYQDILQNDTSLRAIYLHLQDFKQGVPERGFYKIKLKVEGLNRQKNPSPLGNKEEALSIKIAAGTIKDGDVGKAIKSDKFIGEFSLPDDKVHTLEIKTWLEKGYTPKFTFPQGHDTVKETSNRAFKRNKPFFLKGHDGKKYRSADAFKWMKKKNRLSKQGGDRIVSEWAVFMEEYSKHFPTLRMYKVEIEGPFYDEWPHKPKHKLLGDKTYSSCNPEEIITKLAARAFRRPVQRQEIQPILDFVNQTQKQTGSKKEAIANGIRVILCSPQFYYHYENGGKLSDYALANRLSYFIWSTMPDARLASLAREGKLSNKDTLRAEMERMLKDPKAKQLTFN